MIDTSYPPTADEVNALPPNLRKWIHDLETNADPAGTVRQAVLVEQENAQLRAALAERDDDAERYCAQFVPHADGGLGIAQHIGMARIGEYDEPFSKAWFDREIDAAILAKKSQA